ncbi:MAG: trimeric intracellular cation channel family protein [Clostridia bacterium]|nr:trimeric intracellular cation channel family protein [Clostridia bacterium]
MDTFIFIIEIIGTMAFAVSGALTAMRKNMDIFGVIILAMTTAVGGGILRDLILGIQPPGTFGHPVYGMVATSVAVVLFFPAVRRLLGRNQTIYHWIMLLMDSLGLGIFTVIGIQTAYNAGSKNVFLLVFVGVVTGVGGGVIRDVLAGDTPYIFVKHIYACASIAGAILCIALRPVNHLLAFISGAALVLVIRLLAAKFRWSLPRADLFQDDVL